MWQDMDFHNSVTLSRIYIYFSLIAENNLPFVYSSAL